MRSCEPGRQPWRAFAALLAASLPGVAQTAGTEFFEKKVRPVFARSCQACHNPKVKTAGLDLSSAEGFAHGGQSGMLVSGDPGSSRLLRVISYDETLKMPPTGKLKPEEIADLTAWVTSGAAWPGALIAPTAPPPRADREFTAEQRAFWAFQPVRRLTPPNVKAAAWARTPIDRFILAGLEQKGLAPAPPAGKLTLLRRATYDLTGLPPTEAEIRAFLADDSPAAFDKVVNRLLDSSRYGERWGRHWLDVARYADSTGNDEDHRYPYAFRYRDYVIESFNQDLPYDQFVREQVAGDLLPSPDGGPFNRRGIVATGLLALGPKALAQQDKKKMLYDVWDEQVDVVSKAFLGLTVACARCHDHKFDPILTRDYYSLISIFASTKNFSKAEEHVTKMLYRPLVPQEVYERYTEHQGKLLRNKLATEDIFDEAKEGAGKSTAPLLAEYMLAARRVYQGQEDSAAVANQKGLREDVLNRWTAYLKPAGKVRPHLDEWNNAPAEGYGTAAAAYQTRYQERFAKWTAGVNRWREQRRKMLQDMNMPPPDKPKFDQKEDPFFFEVYFQRRGPFAAAEEESALPAEARTRLETLRSEAAQLKAAAPKEPEMSCAVEEGAPVQQRVLIRGDYNSLGEVAPKTFPKILTASVPAPSVPAGSGRLQLADWLTRPEHPLTARVMVNRVWQWHFGEGLVRTPDNFGRMGERPSHPELLDFLAADFTATGWSVKALHRKLMLSNAYQMSSEPPARSLEADPENRLLSRFNRRRLEVEEIRDGMLAIDQTLDLEMGGTLQTGFGTDGENSGGRLSLNPEKLKRRTVYLPLRRSNLPTLMNLFDFGDATTPAGKRPLTNVAPQALFMMNSEFLDERSKNLASAVAGEPSARKRIESIYLRALNRDAAPAEIDAGLSYISRFQSKDGGDLAAWQSLCRVLMASNDFIYVD